jgi:drug/metabolite transporter (DMT)-like permease
MKLKSNARQNVSDQSRPKKNRSLWAVRLNRAMTPAEHKHRVHVIVAFALVYVFWGSTYLAIRIAVEHVPPALMGGIRFLIAGMVMLAFCALTGRGGLRLSARAYAQLGVIGVLLLTIGNVGLAWSELYVSSGLAALIVSVTPIWFLILEAFVFEGDRLSSRGVLGVVLGIAGMVALLWPQLQGHERAADSMQLIASLSLLLFSMSWALGSVLSKRWQQGIDAFTATGWQMTVAGTVNILLAFLFGDFRRVQWEPSSLAAVAYLVVFGSWVGYSAYIWLLKNVPTPKVATYAYVNPIVAVILGWLILSERIDGFIFAGAVIIVAAVALVTSAKVRAREPKLVVGKPGMPPVEVGSD